MKKTLSLVLAAAATSFACGTTESGSQGSGGSASASVTLTEACADYCAALTECPRIDAACPSDCAAGIPARCTPELSAMEQCLASVAVAERCADVPPACSDQFAEMTACQTRGDGDPSPAEPTLGTACAPSSPCGGTLECMSASQISSGKYACTKTCDVDSDCPQNGLCLVFDANDGHYCALTCDTDADCAETGLGCIVGGERLGGRKLCAH